MATAAHPPNRRRQTPVRQGPPAIKAASAQISHGRLVHIPKRGLWRAPASAKVTRPAPRLADAELHCISAIIHSPASCAPQHQPSASPLSRIRTGCDPMRPSMRHHLPRPAGIIGSAISA
ncbi:hypothetical protein PsYK624_111220 [Phanerochaete sordida]|uniref:Uncharacterized protein n=1 Tax=Phanerochaete sordida TaxID=48140 RepID=A0A9P3LGW6_9APHY|nr:hypothetical protein PsYK624_111220 [Phanerochaete sordida]